MDPQCCNLPKFSTSDLGENTILGFAEFLVEYDIATRVDKDCDATEPSAKIQRRDLGPKLSNAIRFDHLKGILDKMEASATIHYKFGEWRAAVLLEPTCDIHPVTYLTAFLTTTPRLASVDCANVSLSRCLDTDLLCDQVLALDEFSWEERMSCVEFTNALALAPFRTITQDMRSLLEKRGLPAELQSMIDPKTLVATGRVVAELWNPKIKHIPSSEIDLVVLKSDQQEAIFAKVLDVLRKDGRLVYYHGKGTFQAVGRFAQGLIRVILSNHSLWRDLIQNYEMYIDQVCLVGKTLQATLRGSRDLDSLYLRGGFTHSSLSWQRVGSAQEMGFSLPPKLQEWQKDQHTYVAPIIPVLNMDLPGDVQHNQLAHFGFVFMEGLEWTDEVEDEDEHESWRPLYSNLPHSICTSHWYKSCGPLCIRSLRPTESQSEFKVNVPYHCVWFSGGREISPPESIAPWTGVCIMACALESGAWEARIIYLD